MEFALPTALAALAVLIGLALVRRSRRVTATAPSVDAAPRSIVVRLAIGDADPSDPRVQRLVGDAARRQFAQFRDAGEVVVVSRTGRLLGRVPASRPVPPPASPTTAMLIRPPASRRSAESSAGIDRSSRPGATPHFDARERPAERRPVAESFDLSPAVRKALRNPRDPVDLVRAILEAQGAVVRVDGDAVHCGDVVVIVTPPSRDTMMHDALNRAYHTFRASGARRGIVLGLELWDPLEVRRREIMAPELRHAGPDAIQRMADAEALGADPIEFAVAPAVDPSPARRAG